MMLLTGVVGDQEVTVVGSSMGAAVIWSYIELYGQQRLAKAVFVDQVIHMHAQPVIFVVALLLQPKHIKCLLEVAVGVTRV